MRFTTLSTRLLAVAASVLLTAASLKLLVAAEVFGPPSAEARRYQEMFHPTRPHEHLIIGSSHAAWGVDPRCLSGAYYNFSMPATSLKFHGAWYDLYRRYNAPPKTIIYGADWFMFSSYCDKVLDEDCGYFPGTVQRQMLRENPRRLANWAHVKRDITFFQQRFGILDNPTQLEEDGYFDGFTPVTSQRFNSLLVPAGVSSDLRRASELRSLLRRFQQDGARVVLVQTPEYLPFSGDHGVENRAIAGVARDLGVPFLNFNDELRTPLNGDRRYFIDYEHLNAVGARVFGRGLQRILASRGFG